MLLELPKGNIMVDHKPGPVEDLRVNVAPNRQLRIKFNVIRDGQDPVPLDIVVYEYKPTLEGLASLAIGAEGIEMTTNRPFKLTLSYDFLKKRWRLRGLFNGKNIDETMNHWIEMVNVAKALV